MKKFYLSGVFALMLLSVVNAQAVYADYERRDDRYYDYEKYEHIYMNPPKPSLYARGRYVVSTSGVRYVHSKSKGKRAAHAARINAYNYQLGNY